MEREYHMPTVSTGETVTAIVAIYGALLSTYTFVAHQIEKKPKMRVKISTGLSFMPDGTASPSMVYLTASNIGQRPITLSSYGFQLPNKMTMFSPRLLPWVQPLPHELLPGTSYRMSLYASALAQSAKEQGYSQKVILIGWYEDAVSRKYKSKAFRLTLEGWK
jgi:hypothetical protein